ncbi:MAG TPA: ABC transporter permease [Candidatus Acidoferrales bacterium]|nr:ABC transporter permease [Candidatus Acidoferrales bacterium]
MAAFWLDLKYAVRSLSKSPAFSAVVILTLALGIGGNAAIFSIANAIFFRPLPFPKSSQLVRILASASDPSGGKIMFNAHGADYEILKERRQGQPFTAMLALNGQSRTLTGQGTPARVQVIGCADDWQAVLGVQPIVGRWFSNQEQKLGESSGVAVIASSLWASRFAQDVNVLGKTLSLDGRVYSVVGVLPAGFRFPYDAEVWVPTLPKTRPAEDFAIFARLAGDIGITATVPALRFSAAEVRREHPETSPGFGFVAEPIRRSLAGNREGASLALLGVSGFFLLLASFNVANLLLARSVTRRRELQLRAALGATRSDLIRRSITETLVLAFAGGAVGLFLVAQSGPLTNALLPSNFGGQLSVTARTTDVRVLIVTLALCLLTGGIAGLLPAFGSASVQTEGLVRQSTRISRSRGERRLMDAFVVVEFTLALALIAGAGLMIRNFQRLMHRDLGIDTRHLLTMKVSTTAPIYASASGRRLLAARLMREVQATPGVAAAGITTVNPLGGGDWTAPVAIEGMNTGLALDTYSVNHRLVTPGLFDAMGIELLEGRIFNEHDTESSPGVAVISQRMARKYWPAQDALGKRVRVNRPGRPWLSVVGVVNDVEDAGDPGHPRETWYLPYSQNAETTAAEEIYVMAKAGGDPRSITTPVEESVHRVDSNPAVFDVSAMESYYVQSLSQERLSSISISVLAAFGLFLGALGIYGTLSFAVSERIREIGIRIALGAERRDVLRLMLKGGLKLCLLASILGCGAAWALGRVLASQLSQVNPMDPFSVLLAGVLLMVVASLAIYLPARRAAGVDPIVALRQD